MSVRERFQPSLRAQFVASFLVAGAIVAGIVVFVSNNQNDPNEDRVNPASIAEQSREATIVLRADQAPHALRVAARSTPTATLIGALTAYMNREIADQNANPPLQRVVCTRTGGTPARAVLSCSAYAADVRYPFAAVVQPEQRQVVYCRREYAPVSGQVIPLSPRCT
jgi:hypothetical protein